MRTSFTLFVAILLLACVRTPVPADHNSVRIVRDDYGTPHIYANNIYGLYYGYGYAVAQDRLFQLEMALRSTQGKVAEVLGPDYLEYDKKTRRLFAPASIRRQLDSLMQKDQDVFAGYAAGLNAWLEEIRAAPDKLTPKQFYDLDFNPTVWTSYDVAMIFVGTMNNRYGDFNTELENANILSELIELHGEDDARRLFDLLNPRFTDNAPTTIPREDWSRPAPDVLTTADMKYSPAPVIQKTFNSLVMSGFSNCYVIGKDKLVDGGSILINGPQFGWFNPSYVYSVGMHGAGIDVVGNTPFGYPIIMFGHNKTITWGSTWGASDIVDVYAEQLNPDDPGQYLYNGEYIDLLHRVETIKVRGADDVNIDVYRSVHGPIVRTDLRVAYAKHRAWDGGELDTLLAWMYATWAPDFASWKKEAEKSAINVNMYFADVQGNIGYFHGGHIPVRTTGHDNRFPVTGDGSMDWRGRQSVAVANPHVLNPSNNFLANWNNKPGQGVLNPDFFFYSWSGADRVDILHDVLRSSDKFTADSAWALIEESSYADVHASYLLPLIDDAVREQEEDRANLANGILQRWDRQSVDSDQDGYYDDAATAIFQTFVGVLLEQVLSDDLGDVFGPFSTVGYPAAGKPTAAGMNIQTGMKAVIESLAGRGGYDLLNGDDASLVIAQALIEALDRLKADQGNDITAWRLPVAARPFSNVNFLGVPQAGDDETIIAPAEQNRGTENNMIVMQEDAIIGWEVTPPGQSGFVSPSGDKAVHYEDQLEMYNTFGKKRMWFYASDVEENKRSEIVITY